jgi:hypothetical protein
MTRGDRPDIKAHVLAVLESANGTPVAQVDLAWSIRHHFFDSACALDSARRRAKEAVSSLVRDHHPIASDRRGYRLDPSPEGRAEGRRFLVRQIAALGQRLRAFDKSAGLEVDQLVLRLGGDAG